MRLPLKLGGRRGAALVLAWLLLTLWVRPLALPDEGRYVGVAWEMLRSGDWLVPTLDGLPFFHKPPLFYWITAASLQLFGVHPWAARLAPLLGALLMLGALYLLLRRRADEASAQATVLVLATMPYLVGGSQFANLDMLVAGCISASLCAAADASWAAQQGEPWRRQVLAGWGFAALGVLAKGLIGVVLPAAVLLPWLLLTRQWRGLRALLWWPAPLLATALALPWFVLVQQRHPGFLHYFFVYQHFQRFAASGFNNVQPLWFYPAALLLLALPWSPGLLWGRTLRPGPRPLASLMGLWFLVILVFFSWPRSKLIGYALPLLPPLAWALAQAWRARWGDRVLWRVAALSALVSAGAMVAVARLDDKSAQPLVAPLQARQPGEPLLLVGRYPYDLPLLLREPAPLPVFHDWGDGETRRDSWAKELADAGAFVPARAQALLLPIGALRQRLCAAPVSWVVLSDVREAPPELKAATELVATRHLRLLRLDLSAPADRAALCDGTPRPG